MAAKVNVKVGKGNLKMVRIPGIEPALWTGSKPGRWLDIKGEVVCQVRLAVNENGACRFECRVDIAGAKETLRLDSEIEYSLDGAMKWLGGAASKYC